MRTTMFAVILVLGAAAVAAGLWMTTGDGAAGSGWTAYSPLSAAAYAPAVEAPWWPLALVVLGAAAAGTATALLLAALLRRDVFTDQGIWTAPPHRIP